MIRKKNDKEDSENKNDNVMLTKFYLVDENGDPVMDPDTEDQVTTSAFELVKKPMKVNVANCIEGIYISAKYQTVQNRVYDAEYYPIQYIAKRMVSKKKGI